MRRTEPNRRTESGGGYAKLQELGGAVVSQTYDLAWERECLDLTELARLRWVEGWKIGRLAEYFGISGSAVKKRLNLVKDAPSKW